jgi:hypothetical protein
MVVAMWWRNGTPVLAQFRLPIPLLGLGCWGLFGFHLCYFFAFQKAPAVEAFLLVELWPILIVLVAGLWFFQALNALSPAIVDLMVRALPALLVVVGLMLFLGRRVRFGNSLAFLITIALLAGVITAAYAKQSSIPRQDYLAAPIAQLLEPTTLTLNMTITARLTEIEVTRAVAGDRTIRAQFVGSFESDLVPIYTVADGVGTFTLEERARNSIPALTQIGSGKLSLILPAGVTVEQFTLTSTGGSVTFDSTDTLIKRLNIAIPSGDLQVIVANQSGLIGDLKTGSGAVTLTVPPTIAAELTLRGAGANAPTYDQNLYTLSKDNVLVPKTGGAQIQLSIDAPGAITIR